MKQLAKGILVGSLATVAAIASGVLTFHKTVIKPVEEEEEKFLFHFYFFCFLTKN